MKGLVGALLGLVALTSAYPAYPNPEGQDYLQMVARLAASKGEDLFDRDYNSKQYPGGYYGYDSDYPPEVLDFQEMLKGKGREPTADLMEEEDYFSGKLRVVENWPVQKLNLGQIGGVAVCPEGYPHVFHRGERIWGDEDDPLFDRKNNFLKKDEGPIRETAVVRLNGTNGVVLDTWGEGLFYVPHGLTIDKDNNFWMTDVALHQVFKFKSGEKTPSLVLGKPFEPAESNDDLERFCKPTDVAVASNGDFFVADGYCNQRVVKYNAEGDYLGHFEFRSEDLYLPHSIALIESRDEICVAMRENMTVICYDAGMENSDSLGEEKVEFTDKELGHPYAIEYSPVDGVLYGVGDGNVFDNPPVPKGFTIDVVESPYYSSDVIATWSPHGKGFEEPHDVAVSPSGEAVYVGELGTEAKNLWKMVKAGEDNEEEEELEELNPDDEAEDEGDEEEEEEEEEDEEDEEE